MPPDKVTKIDPCMAWGGKQSPICDNHLEIKKRWRARQLWLSIFACWMTEEAITGCH